MFTVYADIRLKPHRLCADVLCPVWLCRVCGACLAEAGRPLFARRPVGQGNLALGTVGSHWNQRQLPHRSARGWMWEQLTGDKVGDGSGQEGTRILLCTNCPAASVHNTPLCTHVFLCRSLTRPWETVKNKPDMFWPGSGKRGPNAAFVFITLHSKPIQHKGWV